MNPGTCVHFNGVQNSLCKQGVSYELNWPSGAIPCVRQIHKSKDGSTLLAPGEVPMTSEYVLGSRIARSCPRYKEPTAEQVALYRKESARALKKAEVASKVVEEWRLKEVPSVTRVECVECPVCKGALYLKQSAVTGGMSGICSTKGCVAWME